MKNLLVVLLFFGKLLYASDVAVIKVKSDVKSAIVYLDGAEVMRSKSIDLKAGRNELIFEGLSPKLNPRTIQVNTPRGVEILSLTSKINYLVLKDHSPYINGLRDSVTLINRQISSLNDEKNAYDMERDLLVSNKSLSGKDRGVPIAELREAADFYRNRLLEINKNTTEIALRLSLLRNEVVKLNNQLTEANNKNSIQRGEISILLSCDNAQKASIELKYLVNETGWIPTYDIKATEINEPVQLIYRAKVYNNSDVDWNNVQLILSSADPKINASKPILEPWYLHYRGGSTLNQNAYAQTLNSDKLQSSESKRESSSSPSMNGADFGGGAQNGNLNTFQKGALTFTKIAISDINAEFEIPEKYSIPSDAKPYFIKIKEYKLNATFKHFSIPKENCDVFLLARITGWEDLDILEGTASIYLNGTFTGQSFIDTRNVNDTLDLSLGRDNKVLVKRTKQSEFNKTKQIGSNKKETFAYEIVIKNNHKVPIDIEVIDQLPVPQDSDIEVEKIELSNGLHNELNGELRWNYHIVPADTKKINLSFSIKYPKNKPINSRTQKFRSVMFF